MTSPTLAPLQTQLDGLRDAAWAAQAAALRHIRLCRHCDPSRNWFCPRGADYDRLAENAFSRVTRAMGDRR